MKQEEQQEDEEIEVISDAVIVDEFKAWIDTVYVNPVAYFAFSDNPVFTINYDDIIAFSVHDLPRHFQHNIDQALDCLKQAISEKMFDTDILHENTSNKVDNIQVRLQNYDEPISLRDITTIHNKKMICVNCIIAKASEEKPYMTKSVYLCSECGQHQLSQKNKHIKKCPSCEAEGRMVLDIEQCVFQSYRNIVIQDLPEDLPAGAIPISKPVIVFGEDLTHSDICRPGSRVKLTAIVRLDYDKNTLDDIKNNADPLGILEAQSTGTTFALSLTANHIEALGDNNDIKQNNNKLSKEDIATIESYKKNLIDLNDILVNSFAPHIFGHEHVKDCLLLALVASSGVNQRDRDSIKKRGDINILLVGNAGVAKSQMLLYAAKISPRCIYVSGRGSSGVGLTAAVTKDEKTGSMMLEAGATVLADEGALIIDEFDKLKADDRSALHEVMEQQTCSVAKGGIVATLNARVSILAAANPITGTYDSYKTLAENTGYPPSLISRFDFIFVIKDFVDEQHDSDIANIILLGNTTQQPQQQDKPIQQLDTKFLAKYIQYIKARKDPELSTDAANIIREHYIKLRQKSEQDKDGSVSALTVTARLVDTLKRASIARAKLLQKDTVDREDVYKVITLLSKMYASFGIMIPSDPNSPNMADNVNKIETINLGLLYGKPASQMSKHKVFIEICDALTANSLEKEIDKNILIKELRRTRKFVTDHDAEETIRKAITQGVLDLRKGSIYSYNRDMINI